MHIGYLFVTLDSSSELVSLPGKSILFPKRSEQIAVFVVLENIYFNG